MKLIKHLCMRHIALALLLLFVSSCKQSVKEEAISELNKVALQKVEKLFKDASDSIESNPKAALLLVNKSILLIRQRNLKQSETEALYLKGRCNRFLEKKPEAYAAITSSLKMSIEYHDNYYRVLNLIELAEIWFNQLKYKEADSLLNQADSLAQEFKFRNCLSAIYNNKAKIADNMGDKTKAFQQYLLAAELFKIEKQNKALATVYNNMGILSLDISNNKEALRYIKLSIEINKRNNYTAKLAENYNNLGVAYCATDSIDKGYEAYSISQFLYKKVGRFADLAKSYLNVANLMAKRKEFDKAEKYYDSSLVICLQYDIQYGIILNKINYGNLFAAKGFHQKAIEYFITSLD